MFYTSIVYVFELLENWWFGILEKMCLASMTAFPHGLILRGGCVPPPIDFPYQAIPSIAHILWNSVGIVIYLAFGSLRSFMGVSSTLGNFWTSPVGAWL